MTHKHKIIKSVSKWKYQSLHMWGGRGNGIGCFCSLFPTNLSYAASPGTICLEEQVFSGFLHRRKCQFFSLEKLYWSICDFFLPPVLSDCILGQYFYLYISILPPVFLQCYSVNVIAASDIQLQTILLNRTYTLKTKESLFFLCFHLFISNISCMDHLGQSCQPLEVIYVIYHIFLIIIWVF